MVRLEEVTVRGGEAPPPPFQFHDGTIRSFDLSGERYNAMHFNSTMVRLEVDVRRFVAEINKKFQFHDGTIRRSYCSASERG